MKIKELNFNEPIEEQLEEINATVSLKSYDEDQIISYITLAIPKHLRRPIVPNMAEIGGANPVNVIKTRILTYAAGFRNPERKWDHFMAALRIDGERIEEYVARISALLLCARPNAIQDYAYFIIKPKIIACISGHFQPMVRMIPNPGLQNLILMCQSYLDNVKEPMQKDNGILSVKRDFGEKRKLSRVTCWNCGGIGHIQKNCKKLQLFFDN